VQPAAKALRNLGKELLPGPGSDSLSYRQPLGVLELCVLGLVVGPDPEAAQDLAALICWPSTDVDPMRSFGRRPPPMRGRKTGRSSCPSARNRSIRDSIQSVIHLVTH
jgi:hypothetical protein